MSDKSLRASITFVDLKTSVTHVVPVVQVGHVLMVVSAAMDTSGRYRYIQELAVVTDAAALSVGKITGDTLDPFTDSQTFSVDKAAADSISLSDSIVTVLIFLRDFTDSVSLSDSPTKLISPAYVESVTPADDIAFAHTKVLADGFAMNDMADAGGPVWSFSDTTANIVTMSDSSLLSNDKGVTDNIVVSDSGVLSMQDYCDLTYFAEDYVGVSRTF
jgi:hypothetical protein